MSIDRSIRLSLEKTKRRNTGGVCVCVVGKRRMYGEIKIGLGRGGEGLGVFFCCSYIGLINLIVGLWHHPKLMVIESCLMCVLHQRWGSVCDVWWQSNKKSFGSCECTINSEKGGARGIALIWVGGETRYDSCGYVKLLFSFLKKKKRKKNLFYASVLVIMLLIINYLLTTSSLRLVLFVCRFEQCQNLIIQHIITWCEVVRALEGDLFCTAVL